MIYFGWEGWGPWSTWSGFIWFVAGGLSFQLTMMAGSMFRNRSRWRDWLLQIGLFLWFGVSTGTIAGYYSWFAGVQAEVGNANEYIHSINDQVAKWKSNGCK